MLNVIVVHAVKKLNLNSSEILVEFSEDDYKFEIDLMDPFKLVQEKRGFVYRFPMLHKGNLIQTIMDLVHVRLMDVRKYPLKICIFEYNGTALVQETKNGTPTRYMRMDGDIIHTLVQKMNFTPIYYPPEHGSFFGSLLDNGSFTGSLAEVENGNADILANMRIILDYGQTESEFLTPIDEAQFAFLTPKMAPAYAVTFFGIFSPEVYALLCLSYLSMEVTWLWLQKVKKHLVRIVEKDAGGVLMLFFGSSMLVSQPKLHLNFQRCLYIFWAFFSLINGFIYCATMVEHLTTGTVSMDLDSVEELAQSDLKILTVKSMKDLIKNIALIENAPPHYKTLYSRQLVVEDRDEAIKRVAMKRDSAFLCTLLFGQIQKIKSGLGNKLHVLQEGIPSRYKSHLVPLTSPYTPRFNEILMKIRESGLMPKWKDDVFYRVKTRLERNFEKDNLAGVYSMRELGFLFWCWMGCCGVAFLVFLGELYLYHKDKKVKFKWKIKFKW